MKVDTEIKISLLITVASNQKNARDTSNIKHAIIAC